MQLSNTELILIRVTGEDRPGLTSSVTEILAFSKVKKDIPGSL